ncbi:FAD-binding oxidoreductase (plasmid) [Streptomyces sp. NBC_00190]|uniref:FAD-binding oxidoreductase n=1 Tax=unclassified Streptomyces TaxID=2593676 RepID=UPI002E2BF026|nr:FAD-binding oxidoreductase [Streptomyces sp. NBC_00190]WSZ45675.1 FAD-binding oxidoreductase [Streptomyces sp. NBC_00868]
MLRDELKGELVLPSDPGYRLARQLQNTEYDSVTPYAVAYCESHEDVLACVRHAQDTGVRAHVRGSGHSFNGWSTGTGLVIDLSRMNHAVADGPAVRIGAGVQSLDALDTLKAQGRQIVTGTFPTVSQGGFLTGGGLGWQTRKFGVASDRILSARVVLADGRTVRACADEHPDLYWALRGGGGGNFGIVTEFELRPVDAPLLTAFETLWSYEDAPGVLAAWQAWAAAACEDLGTSLVVLPGMFGPGGKPIVKIWGVHHGAPEELERALDELTEAAGTKPVHREVGAPGAYAEVMHEALCGSKTVQQCHRTGTHPDAIGHRHPYTRQAYRLTGRPVTHTEAESLLGAWNPDLDNERYLLCIALGGAANRVGRTETAYVHRDAQFLTGFQIATRDEESAARGPAELDEWADRCGAALAPLATGSYINFPSSRVPADWEGDHYAENAPRLRDIKRAYDPEGFFRHGQSIGAGPDTAHSAHQTTKAGR